MGNKTETDCQAGLKHQIFLKCFVVDMGCVCLHDNRYSSPAAAVQLCHSSVHVLCINGRSNSINVVDISLREVIATPGVRLT